MYDELLDEATLAARLDRPKRTLQHWRVTGCGTAFLRIGGPRRGRIVYSWADVEAWLATCRRTSTSDPGPKAA